MSYRVLVTARGEQDLQGIYDHIAFELGSPRTAAGQLDRLQDCILSLDEMPLRYAAYDREPWKSRGLRQVTVDRYCVFYIVDQATLTVSVQRILYGGRDISAVFPQ